VIEAILFDLGNVVLEIDFRRTFDHWARHAGVEVTQLHRNWSLDDAYEAHERGHIDFETYIERLGDRLGIELPLTRWEEGWNELFIGPFESVQNRLGELAGSIPLYAFTNTNATHEVTWRGRYPQALSHFEEIFVSSSIGMRKPDREAYEWVADAMELAPSEILFLDDNAENVEGARAAGLQTVWVQREEDVVDALRRF
jgi:putative hydrolase of the HAD superfamily